MKLQAQSCFIHKALVRAKASVLLPFPHKVEVQFQAGFRDIVVLCVAVYMQAEISADSPGENSRIERKQ